MEEQSKKLVVDIKSEIASTGPMPFSRFMELCLYHPDHGYYMSERSATGRSGDFYTAPHAHRLFGATVANWIMSRAEDIGRPCHDILELGSGNGQLAEDMIASWEESRVESIPNLTLVEGNPHRRASLEEKFSGRNVTIIGPEDWEGIQPFHGFVVANEFFDALPVRVITRVEGELFEVMVTHGQDGFAEALEPYSTDDPLLARVLDTLPEGYRTEYSDGWQSWLKSISSKLLTGVLLIFDYGETSHTISLPWRDEGSLRCYRGHQVDRDPFTFPGDKDITANVNFDLLRWWAEDLGFSSEPLRTQSSFLIRAGILDLLVEIVEDDNQNQKPSSDWLQVKNLIHDESGFGEIFKVQVLVKG
jgi:SAM-dependent MidA family methyltransferase